MEREIWLPVVGFEGKYEVSNLGNVRSVDHLYTTRTGKLALKKGRKLYPTNQRGYDRVCLYKDDDNGGSPKRCLLFVHRLVATAFIPNDNPNNNVINHLDETKSNNVVENLEWTTFEGNNNYGTRNERISKSQINGKKSKRVSQYDLDMNLINTFVSVREAQRVLGFNRCAIQHCCKGRNKTAFGYIWKYE